MPTLKLTVFGSPQLELNGIPVQLATRKALALLAYLAVNHQVQSREKLVTMFWPKFSSDRAFATCGKPCGRPGLVLQYEMFMLVSITACQAPEVCVCFSFSD